MHLKFGEISTIVVTSPEMAKEIFKTHVAFKITSYNFSGIMFSPYGKYWEELRKICNMELLSPQRVQTFKSIREDEVFNLINLIYSQKGSIFNLSRSIFNLTYSIRSHAAFEKRNKDTENFIQLIAETSSLASGFSLADMYPSIKLLQVMNPLRLKLEKGHEQADKMLETIFSMTINRKWK